MACPHTSFHSLTHSQGCWVCCTSFLSCSSRSSIAPQPSRRRLQLQRATGLTSKEQQTSLKQCSHQVPDMAMTGPAALPQESWGGEETSPGELLTTGLKEKLLHIKVRQSLLFLWGYWFERTFSLQVCSAFPSPQLLPGAVLGTICLFVINQF